MLADFHVALRSKSLKLSGWRVLQPLYNAQHIFAFDLQQTQRLSSSDRRLPLDVKVEILRDPENSDRSRLFGLLARGGLRRSTVEERLNRSDLLVLAVAHGELAACTWTTFTRAWISEARRWMLLRNDEAVQFDTLVMPSWRGKGLQYGVTLPALQHLASLGYRRTLAWVNARNTRSIRNQLSQGKRKVAVIRSSPLFGLVHLQRVCEEADFNLAKGAAPCLISSSERRQSPHQPVNQLFSDY
jgi:hypothetical protein